MSHCDAPLTETGGLCLGECIVGDGWSIRRVVERFQVAPVTAQRWARGYRGYRGHGWAGMTDRGSRPRLGANRTPTGTERRIIKVGVLRRWGPARIAYLFGLNPLTVHRVLSRYGLARLRWLDRPTGRVIRRLGVGNPRRTGAC